MDFVWFWGIATILLLLKLWILELGLIIVTVALCSQISKHLWFSSTLWWPGWYTFWKASDYMIFNTYPTSKNILADGYIVSDFVIKEWLNWVLQVAFYFCWVYLSLLLNIFLYLVTLCPFWILHLDLVKKWGKENWNVAWGGEWYKLMHLYLELKIWEVSMLLFYRSLRF